MADLVEDAEHLIGIDGSHGEIVVGVAPVVEVEAAEHVRDRAATPQSARCSAPGNDGRYPPAPWRWGRQLCAEQQRHAPVGDIGVIERGLEGFVLHQHALIACHAWREWPAGLRRTSAGDGGCSACRDSSSHRRTRAKGRGCPAASRSRRCRACGRAPPGGLGIGIAQRAILIDLVLKDVGVDRPGAHAVRGGHGLHGRNVGRLRRAGPRARAERWWGRRRSSDAPVRRR